jgi:hypothetical protein
MILAVRACIPRFATNQTDSQNAGALPRCHLLSPDVNWEAAAARGGRNLRPGHIRAGAMLRSRCSPKQLTSSLAAARRRRWGQAPAIDNPPRSLAASSVSRICRMARLGG